MKPEQCLLLLLLATSVNLGSTQSENQALTEAIRQLTSSVQGLKDTTVKSTEAILKLTKSIEDLKNDTKTELVPRQPTCTYGSCEPDPCASGGCHPCGGTPGWRRVAYLNMSRTHYHCPAGWRLHPEPTRSCGRASHDGQTCDSAFFPVPEGSYSKICGRVVGYQFGATAGFYASVQNHQITINESYVTGVSITHGKPREHVWTYAAGRFEGSSYTSYWSQYCPCEHVRDIYIPAYVGAYWYCESGDNNQYGTRGYNIFSGDPLWDGKGCRSSNKCCQFDGPVYFTRTLHEPSSDPIEARICNYFSSQYSDVLVSHLELYVK